VDFAFGHGDPLEYGSRLFFDPGGKRASADEFFDLGKISAVFMFRMVVMIVVMLVMVVIMIIAVAVSVMMVTVRMFVLMSMGSVLVSV
jgi:hypothetical protein